MASNSGVQQHFQQQQNSSAHPCKECGLCLNSAESLEVHLQYHKENLLNKWATQAATSHSEETNNNNSANKAAIKREFIPNNTIAPADSSDSMNKKSPEYSRTTPETIFGHPPTPQSYQSASSPYQNHDNSAFSPNFQNYQQQQIKTERTSTSPSSHYQQQNNYHQQSFPEPQFFAMEQQQQQYAQEFPNMHKAPSVQTSSYRYHPYQQPQHSPYDRAQVSSSSPAYPPQPTPSPSPKQCDKCGYVCDSASQLIDHLNMSHPPTPASHMSSYHPNQHFLFGTDPPTQIKTEEETQSEILDLDSHKVHQVYPEEEKRQNGGEMNGHNPHSVSALLNSWSPQQKMFQQQQQQEQRVFMNAAPDAKMFQQQQEQKIFQPHQIHSQEFMGGGVVTTTTQDNGMMQQGYRGFEQPSAPVISSTQVGSGNVAAVATTPSPVTKSANWKSNEARRPKTYNCTACNKWFTSSGHLKRHYNTTLHKNAVKSSGQPDPATLPISAHHHPARESTSNKEDQSSSPGEEDTNSMPMPGLLQQPPNGPYDRPPPLQASPPNGEAGLSPTTSLDSRGLLSLTSTNTAPQVHGFTMGPPPPSHMMPPIENSQFQMYPNESAPHVTQDTVTSNLSITGEFENNVVVSLHQDQEQQQPLPSFAHQFQAHRYGVLVTSYDGTANVGGGGPATAPYTYYTEQYNPSPEAGTIMYKTEEDEYRLTVLTVADPASHDELEEPLVPYSPPNHNNNTVLPDPLTLSDTKLNIIMHQSQTPEKAHIKRDYEENTGSPLISSTVQNTTAAKQGIHKCIDCDKLFNKACYLTQHNKTFHSGDKPFKCTRCGKRFSSELTYQEHLSKHAGEKPHKCDLCPKQFNHKTDLRRHMCLHTGQKPYSCDTCGKGFIRKDHMLKHCETHYRKSQNKMAAMR